MEAIGTLNAYIGRDNWHIAGGEGTRNSKKCIPIAKSIFITSTHCMVVQDFEQVTYEAEMQNAAISEPYRSAVGGGWVADSRVQWPCGHVVAKLYNVARHSDCVG